MYAMSGNALPLRGNRLPPKQKIRAMHCPFLHRRGYITEGYVCDVWQSIKNFVFDALPSKKAIDQSPEAIDAFKAKL